MGEGNLPHTYPMTKDTARLEKLRKERRLTIVAFVECLPIQRSTYYGWINGEHEPDVYRMRECLRLVGLTQK